jgi:hypothetical protein
MDFVMSGYFTAYGRNFDIDVVSVALERIFYLTLGRSQVHLSIIKNSIPTQHKTNYVPRPVNAL